MLEQRPPSCMPSSLRRRHSCTVGGDEQIGHRPSTPPCGQAKSTAGLFASFGVGYDVIELPILLLRIARGHNLTPRDQFRPQRIRPPQREHRNRREQAFYRRGRLPLKKSTIEHDQRRRRQRRKPAATPSIDFFLPQAQVRPLHAAIRPSSSASTRCPRRDAKATRSEGTESEQKKLSARQPIAAQAAEDDANAFVAKLWATSRVGEIIDEIDLRGRNELVNELVELAELQAIPSYCISLYNSFLI